MSSKVTESMSMGESVSGTIIPGAGLPVSLPAVVAYVCTPCGKLLGIASGPPPKCCSAPEFVVKVDARTIVLGKDGTVTAARHV
jgi:hypothetical protein